MKDLYKQQGRYPTLSLKCNEAVSSEILFPYLET
jgi:hypothetical protein